MNGKYAVYVDLSGHSYTVMLEAIANASGKVEFPVDLEPKSRAEMIVCEQSSTKFVRKNFPDALIGFIALKGGHSASGTPNTFAINPEDPQRSIEEQFLSIAAMKRAKAKKDMAVIATAACG
jgi:hypothetical protein